MKNNEVNKALEKLSNEANRIRDKRKREGVINKINNLKEEFSEDVPVDNLSGKIVIRDKSGRIQGLQG
jgi:hypothetical protein